MLNINSEKVNYSVKIFLKENPFLKIIFPFISGILFQDFFKLPYLFLFICLAFFILNILIYEGFKLDKKIKYSNFGGFNIFILIFFVATILHSFNTYNNKYDFKNKKIYVGEINETIEQTDKTYKTTIVLKNIINNNNLEKTFINEKVIAYFSKKNDSFVYNNLKNYKILLSVELKPIGFKNDNPGSFNFRNYYNRQKINYQIFLNKGDFKFIDSSNKNIFEIALIKSKQFVNNTIKKYIISKSNYGIIEALLIGYKADLDKNILTDYINSGTIHVVAISGLHLGFIYWIFSFLLLKWLNKNITQKIIKCVILIFVLFFYAILAESNPSVLRSALMLSIIAIGDINNKKSSIYNLLGFSAFIILILNTNTLFNLGFILSYFSIVSLILFNSFFKSIIFVKNKLLNYLVEIIPTSIAAQILIFPILAYVFHFIPTFFIINNLIAIPLSTFILLFCLLLLLVSPFNFIAVYIGKFISLCMGFMNFFMRESNAINYSKILLPTFSIEICLLYFVLIFLIIVNFNRFNYNNFIKIICVLIIIFLFNLNNNYKLINQEKFIFYKSSNNNIFEFISGRKSTLYVYDSINSNIFNNTILPCHYFLGIDNYKIIKEKNNFGFEFKNYKIIYLRDFKNVVVKDKIKCDYLILNKSVLKYIDNIINSFNCKKIILDNSFTSFYINSVLDIIPKNYNIYSIYFEGAFVL